jgi:hypothetical protein
MHSRLIILVLAGVLVASLLTSAALAHSPSSKWQSGFYSRDHDSGGAHDHSIAVWANLASPVDNAAYTRSYSGGSLPIWSGSLHQVKITTSRSCYASCSWLANVGAGMAGDQEVETNVNPSFDQNGDFYRIFTLSASLNISESDYGTYAAAARAQAVDTTIEEEQVATDYIEHLHAYDIVE